jgi:DNA-binding SARP family transcriptional activator/pimeloyl-ACP methyl ester carboxylesterase
LLRLLGSPATEMDNHFEPLRLRPKAVALLAYLALAERPVRRHELARLLFPEAEAPLASLRWHLTYLRSSCPSLVVSGLRATREDVALDVPTDVATFRAGCKRLAALADPVDAPAVLALYRDDLLCGLSVSASAEFDTWLYVEQESLRRLFRQAVTGFARAVLSTSRVCDAIEPLSRLVSADPYCEDGHVLLIEAYEALQQSEQARAAYDRYQRAVREDLRAEPRPALAARYEGSLPSGQPLPLEQLVPLNDVTLHIVDWHGGVPAVLGVHGSGMLAYSLGAIAEQLAPDNRFVAVDLRGHGLSDKPRSGYELERHVDDLVQLIGELRLQHPVLLGHSAGGTIAAFVATRVEAAGLILLDGLIGDRAFTENAAARSTQWIDNLDARFGGFESYLAGWRAQRPRWREESERMADRWVHYLLVPLPDGTYRARVLREAIDAEWASIIAANSLRELGRVRCPILIVQATQPYLDGRPYFTGSIVEAQLQAAPQAELFVARSSSHGTLVRDPEPEMIEAIRSFLGRCASAARVVTVRNA